MIDPTLLAFLASVIFSILALVLRSAMFWIPAMIASVIFGVKSGDNAFVVLAGVMTLCQGYAFGVAVKSGK